MTTYQLDASKGTYLQSSAAVIPTSGDLTISVMAKLDANASPTYGEILSQGKSVPGNNSATVGFYLGYDRGYVRVGDSWQDTGVAFPSDGNWHTYQVVKSGNTGLLYIDGVLKATNNNFKNPIDGNNLRIGAQFEGYGEWWSGQVDNVVVYNKALNATELSQIISNNAATLPNALLSLDFSEGLTTQSGAQVFAAQGAPVISASGAVFASASGQYLEADKAYVPTQGDFSVSVMAKLAADHAYDYGEILSQGVSVPGNDASRVGFYLGYERGQIRVGDSWQQTGVAFPTDGNWHSYQVVKSGSTGQLYVDGVLVATNTNFKNPSDGTPLRVGAQFQSYGEYWNGSIDNVRVYATALTSAQLSTVRTADLVDRNTALFDLNFENGTQANMPMAGSTETLSVVQLPVPPAPTYALSASSSSVDEGSSVAFTLATTNVTAGTSVAYVISGVDVTDVSPAQLTGKITVGANGQATLTVPIATDLLTEGPESLMLTVVGKTSTVLINDTSLTPLKPPTYALSASSSSVNEGGSVLFTLTTNNVKSGTSIPYAISGAVTSADLVSQDLSGTLTVDANGQATFSVDIAADKLTEGVENLVFTAAGKSTSVVVNDTSLKTVVTNSTTNTAADEKFIAATGQKSVTLPINVDQGTLTKDATTGDWVFSSSQLGTDTFTGFNRLVFNDKTVALDFEKGQSSYNATMVIGAAFGKEFVNQYFAIGVSLFDSQQTMTSVCDLVVRSGLIEAAVGNTNAAWVSKVYENVVGVKPDPLSSFVFTNYLDTGVYTKSSLLELAVGVKALENQVGLTGLASHGLAYTAFI